MKDLDKMNLDNVQIGGYIVFLLLKQDDGTMKTVSRNIKPEYKNNVEQYMRNRDAVMTQFQVDEFDKFLSQLK